jgi:hypothetical protein
LGVAGSIYSTSKPLTSNWVLNIKELKSHQSCSFDSQNENQQTRIKLGLPMMQEKLPVIA